jgi:hypothetical protein
VSTTRTVQCRSHHRMRQNGRRAIPFLSMSSRVQFCAFCGKPHNHLADVDKFVPGTNGQRFVEKVPVCSVCLASRCNGELHTGEVKWCPDCEQWTEQDVDCWGACGRTSTDLWWGPGTQHDPSLPS